jgi:hypothetical protein
MLDIHIKVFRELKEKSMSDKYKEGVQDCIDILEEAILTGMSITNDEIDTKHKNMKAALETKLSNKIKDWD